MAVIRGFDADGIVACFEEEPGGGAMFDIDAPRNAPAKTPSDYLSSLIWHQDLFQYEIAAGPTDVLVNHTALATKDTYITVSLGGMGSGPFAPSGSTIGFLIQGDTRHTDILLYTHGLGYVPKFMVALSGRRLPDGYTVQIDGSGGHRRASVYATTTGIYLREYAVSTSIDLVATSLTYRVMVFRTRAPDPGLPLFAGDGSGMQLGRGVINTTRKYLRRTGAGDTPFSFNMGRTIDIKNGGVRSATGGTTVSEPRYDGSMSAPAYVAVGVD